MTNSRNVVPCLLSLSLSLTLFFGIHYMVHQSFSGLLSFSLPLSHYNIKWSFMESNHKNTSLSHSLFFWIPFQTQMPFSLWPNSQRRFVDKLGIMCIIWRVSDQGSDKPWSKTHLVKHINLGLSSNLLCEFGPMNFIHTTTQNTTFKDNQTSPLICHLLLIVSRCNKWQHHNWDVKNGNNLYYDQCLNELPNPKWKITKLIIILPGCLIYPTTQTHVLSS